MKNPFDKILNWYFTKNSLPYWCIFIIDCIIIITSGALIYTLFNDMTTLIENALKVLCTMLLFCMLSIVGFRSFHTYSGFMRYSSFVDLMRVVYGNLLNFGLALLASLGMDLLPGHLFVHFNTTTIFLLFVISTLMMLAMRIIVKTLFDVASSNARAIRVLIYGAMTGGVGLAKMINNQRPRRYVVKGFITHYKKAKNQQILGEKVYTVDDDLGNVIKKNRIEAVIVSPYRVSEFRKNQEVQDTIIGAGVKILMTQSMKEMNPEEEYPAGDIELQLREVSVEELLPRDEIRVDLKSVKELLMGQKVLITGAAGSIGSELVRQIAAFMIRQRRHSTIYD